MKRYDAYIDWNGQDSKGLHIPDVLTVDSHTFLQNSVFCVTSSIYTV